MCVGVGMSVGNAVELAVRYEAARKRDGRVGCDKSMVREEGVEDVR